MENIDDALRELNLIVRNACSGQLTEEACKKRLDDFRAKYGENLLHGKKPGDVQNEGASEDKLQKLKLLRAESGTSEETVLEMARTGRKLRQKKRNRVIAAIVAIVAIIAFVIAVVSVSKS